MCVGDTQAISSPGAIWHWWRSGTPPYLVSTSNNCISNWSFEVDTKYGGVPDRHPVPDRPRAAYSLRVAHTHTLDNTLTFWSIPSLRASVSNEEIATVPDDFNDWGIRYEPFYSVCGVDFKFIIRGRLSPPPNCATYIGNLNATTIGWTNFDNGRIRRQWAVQ